MQQPGDAEIRIFIENLYKFKDFGAKKLIREFSYTGWNVKSLSNVLKKLRDSGSMTRRKGSGRRCSVRSDASLVILQGTVQTYRTRCKLVRVCVFVLNFLGRELAKSEEM